jgi:exosortase A-associated hydrolase 2
MTVNDRDVAFEPFFLDAGAMRLFCVYFPPIGGARGNYVFVPPFAEEMNRCRSMVAMQARALAHEGFGTLLVDLFGTGDSSGEFGQATWNSWRDSVIAAWRWLGEQPGERSGIWGLRLGAVLAAELLDDGNIAADHAIFWQPVVSPKAMLTQFLRIKVAAAMDLKIEGPSTSDMRAALKAGASVEVGGYELNPALVLPLDQKALADYGSLGGAATDWIEVTPMAEQLELGAASAKAIEILTERGARIEPQVCQGPLFWQLHERTLAPQIIEITTERVVRRHA